MNDVPEIRAAAKGDLDAAMALWRQLVSHHADIDPAFEPSPDAEKIFRRFLKKCLKNRDALVLVARLGGETVGMCTCLIDLIPPVFRAGRYGRLADLVVDEAHRRRGIATKLLAEVKRWLAENQVRHCRATVARLNPALEGFWKKAGFDEQVVILENRSFGEARTGGGET